MKISILSLFILMCSIAVSAQIGKLFLVAGQSNAVGQGTAALSPICLQGTAFEFNGLTNGLQHLQDPMGQTVSNLEPAATGSIGPAFAKTLNALIAKPIYLVSAARGGSSNGAKAELSPYGTWDDSGNLQVFNSAVNKAKNAIQATGLALSGIIWLQGERDANAIRTLNETEAEYQTALEKVISRFRAQFGPKLPFYIVLTGLQGAVSNGIPVATLTDANYAVRRIQMAVAKKTPNVFVAFTSTDTFFDKGWMKPETTTVHYIQTAYNQIGDSLARFVSTIPYDTITKINPIPTPNSANPQIIVDNTDAGCTFDSPWAASTYAPGFYGSNYVTDNTTTADPTKWAKWTPVIPADAYYNIYMSWTAGANRPAAVPLEIKQGNGTYTSTIDQTINNNVWQYLGNYSLLKGSGNYVKISANSPGFTVADAVLFEQAPIKTGVDTQLADTKFQINSNGSNNKMVATFDLQDRVNVILQVYNSSGILANNILNGNTLEKGKQSYLLTNSAMKKGFYIAVLKLNGKQIACKKFLL